LIKHSFSEVRGHGEAGQRNQPRPVRWVGSSKKDLSDFPDDVRRRVGGALWEAQIGRKAPYAKPLKGLGDAGVLEPTAQASEREDYEQWLKSEKPTSP
jgi:phage-related protein